MIASSLASDEQNHIFSYFGFVGVEASASSKIDFDTHFDVLV